LIHPGFDIFFFSQETFSPINIWICVMNRSLNMWRFKRCLTLMLKEMKLEKNVRQLWHYYWSRYDELHYLHTWRLLEKQLITCLDDLLSFARISISLRLAGRTPKKTWEKRSLEKRKKCQSLDGSKAKVLPKIFLANP
jgi:hypothetical protein